MGGLQQVQVQNATMDSQIVNASSRANGLYNFPLDETVPQVVQDLENAFINEKELAKMRSLRAVASVLEDASDQAKKKQEQEEQQHILDLNQSDVTIRLLNKDYYRSLVNSVLGKNKDVHIDELTLEKMVSILKRQIEHLNGSSVYLDYNMENGGLILENRNIVVTFQIVRVHNGLFKKSVQRYGDLQVDFDIEFVKPKRTIKLEFFSKSRDNMIGKMDVKDVRGHIKFNATTNFVDVKGKKVINTSSSKTYTVNGEIKKQGTARLVDIFIKVAQDFGVEAKQISGCNLLFNDFRDTKTLPIYFLQVVKDNYIQQIAEKNATAASDQMYYAVLFVKKFETTIITKEQYKKFAKHCGFYVIFVDEEEGNE